MTSTLIPPTTLDPAAPSAPSELAPFVLTETVADEVPAPVLEPAGILPVDTPIPLGRVYATSALALTLVCLVVFTAMGVVWTGDWATGLGGGAMMAIWGGPSFGAMVAGARVSARLEAAHD